MTAIETLRALIVAAATPVADRVSPSRTFQGQALPYALLAEVFNQPVTAFSGFVGMDHCHIQVDVWDATYAGADAGARACRTALETAGYACLDRASDLTDAQIDPALQRVGFIFDVWQT